MSTAGTADAVTYNYCNITVKYEHTGKSDTVVVKYAFPEPSSFTSRFYVAGGAGYSLSSDATEGLEYGAVGGATNAGYNAFYNSYDEAVLYGNGSINWDATHMFGYQALGEMTKLAKPLTRSFYGLSDNTKIYTYYEGCSDGGRQGMSQIQHWVMNTMVSSLVLQLSAMRSNKYCTYSRQRWSTHWTLTPAHANWRR
jgi:tannase